MSTSPGHAGSFKNPKMHFEWSFLSMDRFLRLVDHFDFILHILIVLNVFNNLSTIWHISNHSKVTTKCIFEWFKVPKRRFLASIWSLVCWIDLILHIVIVLKCFPTFRQHYQVMKDHSKSAILHFWIDPKEPKNRRFLAIFW